MGIWNFFTGGKDRTIKEDDGSEAYEVETTQAYDEGCLAGDRYRSRSSDNIKNPYSSNPEREHWQAGFDSVVGDDY
jgi:hypothetical protein